MDDASRKTNSERHEAGEVMKASRAAHEALKEECKWVEVTVSAGKKVTQPWVCGKGTTEMMEGWYAEE